MIPIPPDVNRQDLDQWCNRCVVLLRQKDGAFVPHWYHGMLDTGARIVRLTDVRTGKETDASAADLCVEWPLCGSVNTALGYAIHAARHTQKQYRRSFNVHQLEITIPRLWDVAKFCNTVPGNVRTTPEMIANACFFPAYPTAVEAFESLDKGEKITVALNRYVIIAGDATGKRFFYYNGLLAATACNGMFYPVGDVRGLQRIMKSIEGVPAYAA